MNTENEKRWFVYIGDNHEGPLSVEEVFERKQKGLILPESYVWREGMADWLMLSQVSELNQALESMKPVPAPTSSGSSKVLKLENPKPEHSPVSEPAIEPSPALESEETPRAEKNPANPSVKHEAPKKSGLGKRIVIGLMVTLVLLAFLGLGIIAAGSRTSDTSLHSRVRPIIQKITAKAPFLRPAFKYVPTLTDIKPEEAAEMEAARDSTFEQEVRIGVGLSNSDSNRPIFYISTNLPHRTRIDVLLIGNSETLLNRLQFNAQNTLITSHGFGKTDAFLMEGGQPIPKGEYTVHIFESPEQESEVRPLLETTPPSRAEGQLPAGIPATTRFLVSRKYFLGGERDETYLTRLKAFHESIKEKAEKEIGELRQFVDTLILQQSSINNEFQRIFRAKKATPAMKAQWKKTSSTWIQISGQLDQAIQTWSPETLQNEFFYGSAYSLVKTAFLAMQAMVKAEIDYIEKPQDKTAFEIQHGKLLSDSRDAIDQLKTKMDLILKAPKSPGGLPTKEGL